MKIDRREYRTHAGGVDQEVGENGLLGRIDSKRLRLLAQVSQLPSVLTRAAGFR
jgi:hypothetical protein